MVKGASTSMRSKRTVTLTALLALVVGACSNTPASPAASAAAPSAAAPSAAAPSAAASASAAASQAAASPTAVAADPKEAVIKNVESGASLKFWTFFLEPTFKQYLDDTVARFKATYPGVDVTIEDHKGTMKDELNTAFAAGNAPDVINLSVSEGWVSEYAGKGLLLGLDDTVPQDVQSI